MKVMCDKMAAAPAPEFQDKITSTVFDHRALSFVTEIVHDESDNRVIGDVRSVRARCKIPKWEVLLVEHCMYRVLSNPIDTLDRAVRYTPELYNSLFPRNYDWNDSIPNPKECSVEENENIKQKIICNVFQEGGVLILGKKITWFNHSDKPNMQAIPLNMGFDLGLGACFMVIIAIKDIAEGEELVCKYSDVIQFSLNGMPVKMPSTSIKTVDWCSLIPDTSMSTAKNYIEAYAKTLTFKNVYIRQLSIHHGLYPLQGHRTIDPRFIYYAKRALNIDTYDVVEIVERWLDDIWEKLCSLTITNSTEFRWLSGESHL
jgi:hypothetical protein